MVGASVITLCEFFEFIFDLLAKVRSRFDKEQEAEEERDVAGSTNTTTTTTITTKTTNTTTTTTTTPFLTMNNVKQIVGDENV